MEDLKSLTPEQLTEHFVRTDSCYLAVVFNLNNTILAMKNAFNSPPELLINARTVYAKMNDLKNALNDVVFDMRAISTSVREFRNDVIAFLHNPKVREAPLYRDNDPFAAEAAVIELQRLNESLDKLEEFLICYT